MNKLSLKNLPILIGIDRQVIGINRQDRQIGKVVSKVKGRFFLFFLCQLIEMMNMTRPPAMNGLIKKQRLIVQKRSSENLQVWPG